MVEMTEAEAAIMLAEALQTDLIYRLELLHEAGALQLIRAEQGAGAEQMVRSFANNFFAA